MGSRMAPRQSQHLVGCGGGLLVSILAFNSDDPSSNPAGYLNFLNEKTKINKERGRGVKSKHLAGL